MINDPIAMCEVLVGLEGVNIDGVEEGLSGLVVCVSSRCRHLCVVGADGNDG